MRKDDTAAGKCASEEVVGGEQTSRIHGVAERDVHKDTLHDDEDGGSVDGDADGGHDPVDARAGGPGEEEEADGGTEGGDQGGHETAFLDGPAELGDAAVHVVVEVCGVDGDTDDTGDENTEEDETDLAEVHAVVDGVNKREDLEDWGELAMNLTFEGRKDLQE